MVVPKNVNCVRFFRFLRELRLTCLHAVSREAGFECSILFTMVKEPLFFGYYLGLLLADGSFIFTANLRKVKVGTS
jgi:hypothetical protein